MNYNEITKKLKDVPFGLNDILENINSGGGNGEGNTANSFKKSISSSQWTSNSDGLFENTVQHNMFEDIISIMMKSSITGQEIDFSYTILNNNSIKLTVQTAIDAEVIIVGTINVSNMNAKNVSILDINSNFKATDVEGALEELVNSNKNNTGHISNYCTVTSDGWVKDQDDAIRKCISENDIIDLCNLSVEISSTIELENKVLQNGKILKHKTKVDGSIELHHTALVQNVGFIQENFNIRRALVRLRNTGNTKIQNCNFDNSTIDIASEETHYYINIHNCNFSSDNTQQSNDLDEGRTDHHFHPQNVCIRGVMERSNSIGNLIVSNCRANIGRCFLSTDKVDCLNLNNNIIRGNGKISDTNHLNLLHIFGMKHFVISNNIIEGYRTTNSILSLYLDSNGVVSSNVFRNNKSNSCIHVNECNSVNINSNIIESTTDDSFRVSKGIVVMTGNSVNSTNNKISNCELNAIHYKDGNYHSIIANNIMSFNNKLNLEWTASLVISGCFCFNCNGNYIHLDTDNSSQSKVGFSCTDNTFGLLTSNLFRCYIDKGRNTTVDEFGNVWFSSEAKDTE